MDKKEASREVSADKSFYLASGKVIKSVNGLIEELKAMPESLFRVHVTNEKNDFANWIKNVYNDERLASDLLKTKDRLTTAKLIEEDIKHKEDLARIDEIINAKPEKQKDDDIKPVEEIKTKEEPKNIIIKHKKIVHHNEPHQYYKKDEKKVFITALIQGIVIGLVAALLLMFMLIRYGPICK